MNLVKHFSLIIFILVGCEGNVSEEAKPIDPSSVIEHETGLPGLVSWYFPLHEGLDQSINSAHQGLPSFYTTSNNLHAGDEGTIKDAIHQQFGYIMIYPSEDRNPKALQVTVKPSSFSNKISKGEVKLSRLTDRFSYVYQLHFGEPERLDGKQSVTRQIQYYQDKAGKRVVVYDAKAIEKSLSELAADTLDAAPVNPYSKPHFTPTVLDKMPLAYLKDKLAVVGIPKEKVDEKELTYQGEGEFRQTFTYFRQDLYLMVTEKEKHQSPEEGETESTLTSYSEAPFAHRTFVVPDSTIYSDLE